MAMGTSLDSLLNDFLMNTLSLEQSVKDDYSEPEEWIELLNQRQEVIDSLSVLFEQGISLTDAQKKMYLQPAYEVDLRIVPLIDRKKKILEADMMNLNRSKAVNQQYGESGNSYSPYGAFFDKKK
jgi:flagellar protein FliT